MNTFYPTSKSQFKLLATYDCVVDDLTALQSFMVSMFAVEEFRSLRHEKSGKTDRMTMMATIQPGVREIAFLR
jgi:hypothetical protein